MTPLDQAFPGFVKACADIYASLLPWAMALLVIAFATEFWHGPLAAGDLVKFLVKLFLVVLLLAKSQDLVNDGQALVKQWVERNIPARPENVAARYQDKLAQAQNSPSLKDQSFLSTLFSSNWFEAIIFAVLTLISWLAMAVLFLVYCVQRVALLLCWALSPLLFPLLAIRPVSRLGLQHLLRMLGIILWPLGLALAATFTDGLLDAATDPTFLGPSVAGSLGRGLLTLLAVTVVAVWIIFSTVLAPAYIQRLFAGSAGVANVVSQAAGLMSNTGLPALAGAPAAARGAFRGTRAAWGSAARFFSRVSSPIDEVKAGEIASVPISLPITPAAGAKAYDAWRPSPADPTGDVQARTIVERTKKP